MEIKIKKDGDYSSCWRELHSDLVNKQAGEEKYAATYAFEQNKITLGQYVYEIERIGEWHKKNI